MPPKLSEADVDRRLAELRDYVQEHLPALDSEGRHGTLKSVFARA